MIISTRGRYALRVMIDLAENGGGDYIPMKTIAERQGISLKYLERILPQVEKGLCGTILTQLSDVEDETNGLVTYDRRVVKADREVMNDIAAKLKAAVE